MLTFQYSLASFFTGNIYSSEIFWVFFRLSLLHSFLSTNVFHSLNTVKKLLSLFNSYYSEIIRFLRSFFSVIIPLFNKENVIARAINSVLSQTYPHFELIIVCDPSTDQSESVARSFTDSRVRFDQIEKYTRTRWLCGTKCWHFFCSLQLDFLLFGY